MVHAVGHIQCRHVPACVRVSVRACMRHVCMCVCVCVHADMVADVHASANVHMHVWRCVPGDAARFAKRGFVGSTICRALLHREPREDLDIQ